MDIKINFEYVRTLNVVRSGLGAKLQCLGACWCMRLHCAVGLPHLDPKRFPTWNSLLPSWLLIQEPGPELTSPNKIIYDIDVWHFHEQLRFRNQNQDRFRNLYRKIPGRRWRPRCFYRCFAGSQSCWGQRAQVSKHLRFWYVLTSEQKTWLTKNVIAFYRSMMIKTTMITLKDTSGVSTPSSTHSPALEQPRRRLRAVRKAS